MSIAESRRATAEKIFEDFDFIYQVEDADSWFYDEGDHTISRTVYLAPDASDDTVESKKSEFTISFEYGSPVPTDVTCNLDGEIIGELSGNFEDYVVHIAYTPSEGQSWFHGTTAQFDKFQANYIGQGLDELGSGFYFTTEEETAQNYALRNDVDEGFVLVVELDIKNPLLPNSHISSADIRKVLESSPNLEDALWNFGDLSRFSQDQVLDAAVKTYANMNGGSYALELLNAMNNDFFDGEEAAFLAKVTEVTGFDGLYREKGGQVHAVAWNPDQIKITEVRQVFKETYKP